jgi:epoxyqueuosine reductase
MIEEIIKRRLVPSSDYIYGFANIKGLLDDEFNQYPYGISIGKHLDDRIIDGIENGPTMEYFKHYKEVNRQLNDLAESVCNDLREKNINCVSIVPTLNLSGNEFKPYSEKLRYKVSHKMIATRAGLGWIGKTDLFISNAFGPRLRLVSILTDRPLNTKRKTIDKSRCGKCDICVLKCPAQAANGRLWNISTDRDLFFNAHKCREKCGELAKSRLNLDSRICGICVSVCPLGKKSHN